VSHWLRYRGLPCVLPVCVLNEKPPEFLGVQPERPMSQELGLRYDDAQQRSGPTLFKLSVFVIVGRRLKIF
jgi:hypothetical protein